MLFSYTELGNFKYTTNYRYLSQGLLPIIKGMRMKLFMLLSPLVPRHIFRPINCLAG